MKFGHKKLETVHYHMVESGNPVSVSPGRDSVLGFDPGTTDKQTDRITIASTHTTCCHAL